MKHISLEGARNSTAVDSVDSRFPAGANAFGTVQVVSLLTDSQKAESLIIQQLELVTVLIKVPGIKFHSVILHLEVKDSSLPMLVGVSDGRASSQSKG